MFHLKFFTYLFCIFYFSSSVFSQNHQVSNKSQAKGYAIVCSADPSKKFHTTLVFIKTNDLKTVNKIKKLTLKFINDDIKLKNDNYFISWNAAIGKRVMWGSNSLMMGGEIEIFKQKLHSYLTNHTQVKNHIGDYRPAHIDVNGNKSETLYKKIKLNNLYLMPVY